MAIKDSNEKNPNMISLILKINGMTCNACEIRISQVLIKLNGVFDVEVDYSAGQVKLNYNQNLINKEKIIKAIEKIGYQVLLPEEKKPVFKKLQSFQWVGIGLIIAAVWLVLSKTGIFYQIPEINNSMGYGILFIVGLLTSLHCVAMCGGINLSQSVKKDPLTNDSPTPKTINFMPGLLYNTGRILSYTIVGGIVGSIGAVISLSNKTQGLIVIIAGIFMLLMGINLSGIFPWVSKILPKMPKFISRFLIKINTGNRSPFIVGLLNGLMPCGPLQAMQIYALSTGSFFTGALSMFLFSLGTTPLMLGISTISSLLSHKFAAKMIKVSALLIFFLGIGMISRGFALNGINIIPSTPSKNNSNHVAVINDTQQYVESGISASGGYDPIIIQKGIPVKWNLKVASGLLNGCNNAINIPAYGITKKLETGDNIIEFTPENTGNIPFSCWMGMINSNIFVVEDVANLPQSVTDKANTQTNSSPGGSCCSASGYNTGTENLTLQNNTSPIPTDNIETAYIKEGIQYAQIDINEAGYKPAVIVIQRGIKTKLNFNGIQLNDSNYRMIVPAYNSRIELNPGNNTVDFVPEIDFGFDSWNNDFHGYIAVVDNINQVDKSAIREIVKNYRPVVSNQSTGGCCGGSTAK